MKEYHEFIRQKRVTAKRYGFDVEDSHLNQKAFPWQRRIIRWALNRGRAALFLDTGLGKTLCQLTWAEHVCQHTGGKVLLHCPVGVRWQTEREAERFSVSVPVVVCDDESEIPEESSICIINYEKLHKFDPMQFDGVVLDESSILKGLTGKIREHLTTAWQHARYRLACTATPAPNDTQELGNHAEFLGICTREEMLAKYFVHDSGDTSEWRLKGHAEDAFWDWVCTWAACITRPSDIGGDDTGYILPPMNEQTCVVHVPSIPKAGCLFDTDGISATNIHGEKRVTSPYRAEKTAELVNSNSEQWIIWCDTNYEADDIRKLIPDVVEVRGSDTVEQKEQRLMGFSDGKIRVLLTKPSIAGQGLNWQHCNHMVFHSINYSFESRYQAIRRCYRFGQTKTVNVFSVTTDTEFAIQNTVAVKSGRHEGLQDAMRRAAARSDLIQSADRGVQTYKTNKRMELPAWLKQ